MILGCCQTARGGGGGGSGGGAGAGRGAGAAAADGRPRPAEGTLTAASLIDAIITHQISQSADQRFPIIRECSPARAGGGGGAGAHERRESPPREEPPAHTASIKLGDLASNIITRDFCSPTAAPHHHNSRYAAGVSGAEYTASGGGGGGGGGGGAEGEWKRRDPPKHAPYLEPVSPPDTHHANRSTSGRRFSGCVAGGVLTAFDYVTNRIVEVMRSDADERKPLAFPAAYAYPYSALNVPSAAPAAPPSAARADGSAPPPTSSAPAASAAPALPEPAPLMSAQYEPLSDED
ncbi:hypothetical protein MSG28_005487 [Choristoneura fumiferana]|uniref:Uncharacterized protein n=1 Tax=Choristoneura fumiferana TaxID=7141 RepID=A0ACC0L028_CHOFU|nr:hypothetical protein MSG28_005487 [Choristoneura fumiferana]